MALTAADWAIWQRLAAADEIPAAPAVLQIGECNWYGDMSLDELQAAAAAAGDSAAAAAVLRAARTQDLFLAARCFFSLVLHASIIDAIDQGGTAAALPEDLNEPIDLGGQWYDIVYNTGTAEHVFDIAQVFKTCHDACRPGGLMFHAVPFRGWLDHGFYSISPTLIMDVGAANLYQRLTACYFELRGGRLVWLDDPMADIHRMAGAGELGADAMLYWVWRRGQMRPFRKPRQGFYAGSLPAQLAADWGRLR